MDSSRLNKFSKIIYERLCAYNPRLVEQAEEVPQSDGNFYLKIRSPIKEEVIWLGIYTEADPDKGRKATTGGVNWEFDYYHSNSGGTDSQEAFLWLWECLEDLFKGRKFAASRIVGGEWVMSADISNNDLKEILAGNMDYDKKTRERSIEQISKLTNMPENMKAYIIKKLKKAEPYNRIVGWEKIYLK